MTKNITYVFGLLIFFLISCGNDYNYWEISKFKIDNNALEDEEEIKLLYTSRGPDFNNELKYYIHLIGISQKTGDTVNILTTAFNEISIKDTGKVFNFFNQDNFITKLSQMDENSSNAIKHVDDITKAELKKIDKVARDPNFDFIADNSYPTVIGTIGTLTNNE